MYHYTNSAFRPRMQDGRVPVIGGVPREEQLPPRNCAFPPHNELPVSFQQSDRQAESPSRLRRNPAILRAVKYRSRLMF